MITNDPQAPHNTLGYDVADMLERLRWRLRDELRYCTADGVLIKNAIVEDALAMRPQLLQLLLGNDPDDPLRRNFFAEVAGVQVFDKVRFQRFVMNKRFLADSYTAFKNKIGLTTDDEHFLADSHEVVLTWPYKDCILEGGQTKDDARRRETFWSEILAPDQITQLTAPKALTNFKRYSSDGVQTEGIQLRDDDNLIIKGNNLLALYSLCERYRGRIKLIYIDPPYNTGNDSFGYNDSFNHSTWLTFMKNRLTVARDLLTPDGVIFVQCDDNEQAYLKVMMDELFRRENFVTTIHCQMSTTQGMKVRSAQNGNIVKNGEYIHVYSKDGRQDIAKHPLYDIRLTYDEHYSLYIKDGVIYPLTELYDYRFPKDLANKKALSLAEAYQKSEEFAEIVRTHLAEIVCTDKVTGFDISEELKEGEYKTYIRDDKEYLLTLNGAGRIRQLLRLSDSWGVTDSYKNPEGLRKIRGDWWEGFYLDMGNVSKEGSMRFANGKKPERLIHQLISMTTSEGDIVLDYHLGSGTTAAVAHKMGRQYIGVEQMDYIEDIAVERLRKVIAGEQGGISKSVDWQGGGDFVYCELASANQAYIDKIQRAETEEKLLDLWEEMQQRAFLSYKVDPRDYSTLAKELTDLSLEGLRHFLIDVLDKNLLYVPLSELESSEHSNLCAEDRRLTHTFYHEP